MDLVSLPLMMVVLAVGATTMAFAAGGGGSAGGSGAQNAINSGRTMADGQPGPIGAPNHPRPAQNVETAVPGSAAATRH